MGYSDLDCNCLSRIDAVQTLSFMQRCLSYDSREDLNSAILDFAGGMGFEFVLYGFTPTLYAVDKDSQVINLSNPPEWAIEYEREHLMHDPVLHEVKIRIKAGEKTSYFVWDNYTWPLSAKQQQVINRRRHYGLNYGCSVYSDSRRKDFAFLISFASTYTIPDERTEVIGRLIIKQLMATTKRLNLLELVGTLSEKEEQIASSMMIGRTNREIANEFGVTANTVKFHLKNIFTKLQVKNRQQAIGVLVAERYLGR